MTKNIDIKIFMDKTYETIEVYVGVRCFTINPKDVLAVNTSKLGKIHLKEKGGDTYIEGKDIIAILAQKKVKETIYEDQEVITWDQ